MTGEGGHQILKFTIKSTNLQMLALSVTMYFDLACSVPFFCHVSHLVQTLGRRDMLFIISLTSQVS